MTRVIKIFNESDDSMTRFIKLLTSHERLDDSKFHKISHESGDSMIRLMTRESPTHDL